MKKIKIIGFLFFLSINLTAQTVEDAKYEVASFVINHYVSKIDFDYFHWQKPIKPTNFYPDTMSIISFLDPETYETVSISRKDYDSIYLPKQNLEYEKEIKLWELKEKLNKKVIILTKFPTSDRAAINPKNVKNGLDFKDLLEKLNKSDSVSWDASKIANKSEYYLSNAVDDSVLISKYSVVGYIMLSDIIVDETNTKAVVYLGMHYMINYNKSDRGVSGYGCLLCLSKSEKGWQTVGGQGLWEE
jgi:hypothetical protein